jgi:hypothetical protein
LKGGHSLALIDMEKVLEDIDDAYLVKLVQERQGEKSFEVKNVGSSFLFK